MISSVPKPSLETQWLTPARVAWVLDVSERTVRQWYADNEIAHFRVGHVIRSAPEAVLHFILENTRRGKAAPATALGTARLDDQAWGRIERLIKVEMQAMKEAA